ncbi:MAG: hypothetical protein IJ354_00645 [Clostridia bacterium]|nr:hypothetical protein [Clostridia bacterium]
MKKYLLGIVLLLMMALITGCTAGQKAGFIYTAQSYDTVVGKWKSNSGDTMELKEDGTYWRTGKGYSEQGTYRLTQDQWLPIGDTVKPYQCLAFTGLYSSDVWFYDLNGLTLDMCEYVDRTDGSFPKDSTIHYVRQ